MLTQIIRSENMAKRIEFEFPSVELKVEASLSENDEPELCSTLWENFREPTKLFCRHPLSTGYEFSGEGRPPRHPVQSGTQAVPLGRKRWLLSQVQPGSVVYSIFGGYGGISLFYGPCTEPLPARGSVVGRVEEKSMNNLMKAGKAVWEAQYLTHTPILMIVRRKE
jgi:hypothetical protein